MGIIVDNFAGGGGASTGIEKALGRKIDIAINHDPQAILMHKTNHPETKHYCENIWEVDPLEAVQGQEVDLAWFSPDCFVKGTMILSNQGYVPIETLKIGDLVLTHKMRWKPITDIMQSKKEVVKIRGYGNPEIICSKEHPFYLKSYEQVWNNEIRQYRKVFDAPKWIKANDIDKNKFWGTPLEFEKIPIPEIPKLNNKTIKLEINKNLLWLTGRYVGDGWTRLNKIRGELVIVCGKHEISFLKDKLNMWQRKGLRAKDNELSWNFREVRTGGQFSCNSRALVQWLRENFGHLAINKKIPAWLLTADLELKKAFLDGYFGADGWKGNTAANTTLFEITTVSKALAYGVSHLINTMGIPSTVYLNKIPNNVIEGRKVNVHPAYKIKWRDKIFSKHSQNFIEDNILWRPIREKINLNKSETVYNISVAEDETYIAEGIIVHNCKHFSKAKGKKPVDKNIRGLAWVAVKWAKLVKPKVIILENVEEFKTWGPLDENNCPIKSKKGETFHKFISSLTQLGYEVKFTELKACDYGAPTTRKRFFMIARCDGKEIVFPTPTHAPSDTLEASLGIKKPYRTAAEIIDWNIPVKSIFDRKKPLSENTMKRIAKGIKKFVIDSPQPFIVRIGQTGFGGDNLSYSINKPLTTIVSKQEHLLVTPFLATYYTEQNEKQCRGQIINSPLATIPSANRFGLVTAFISKYYGGNYEGAGSSLVEPLHTITAVDHNALITAFISKYYGNDIGSSLETPLHTITSKDKFALIEIQSQKYKIIDIGMRMLQPRELFNAQGFPEDYIIDHDINGNNYPKSEQVARCGNSVSPILAEAIVRANFKEKV